MLDQKKTFLWIEFQGYKLHLLPPPLIILYYESTFNYPLPSCHSQYYLLDKAPKVKPNRIA